MSEVSPGQRVRSMLAVSGDVRLDGHPVPRHVVLPDGSLLVAAQPEVRVGDLVTLLGSDVASVPQPNRVRGLLRMRGVVAPWAGPRSQGVLDHLAGPAGSGGDLDVVCFRPVSIELDWRCETVPGAPRGWRVVPLDDYRSAAPDALVADEHRWLPHLQRDHAEALRVLARRLEPGLHDEVDVRAVVLDRSGLVLRLYAGGSQRDVRLLFPTPASCACAVREMFGELLGHGAAPRHSHPSS